MTAERKPLLRSRPTEAPLDVSWRRDGVLGTLRILWAHLLTSRGLMVSLGVHLILLLIAFVWVISVMKEQRVKQPEFMATGAGGGANGDRARILEHNLQQKKAQATAKTVARMRSGSVIVDIAIDQGGCIESIRPTSHKNPVYEKHGVIHYAVPNMPALVGRTSTLGLTQATEPCVAMLVNKGIERALAEHQGLARGVNTENGKITSGAVAKALGFS